MIPFIALLFRLYPLRQSLWLDEAISAYAAKNFSFIELLTQFPKHDFHPPLFYILLRAWGSMFGYSETALRLLPLLFGVLTVLLIVFIARLLNVNRVKTGLLLATSPLHIYYSQEVRMYAIVAFFASLSIYLVIRAIKENRVVWWILLSLALVTLMFLDYVPVFFLPVIFLAPYLFTSRRALRNTLIVFLPLLIVFIFWLPIFKIQLSGGTALSQSLPLWRKIIGSASVKEALLVWVKFIIGRISIYNKFFYALFVLTVSLPFGLAFVGGIKRSSRIVLAWYFVPLVLGFFSAFFIPSFSYFRYLYILPAFYLILAAGTKNRRLLFPLLLSVNLICTGIYFTNKSFWREDWKGSVSAIEEKAAKDDIVLFDFDEPVTPFVWYSSGNIPAFGTKGTDVREVTRAAAGVWYFDYLTDITDPDRNLLKNIQSLGYDVENEYGFPGVGKVLYLRRD